MVDMATGLFGALSVLAAIHQRTLTNTGIHIDISLAQSALQLMRPVVSRVLSTERDAPRAGNRGFSGSPGAATFRCADGWLAVAANTQAQFRKLCELLGIASLADDSSLIRQVGQGGTTNVTAVDRSRVALLLDEAFARLEAAMLETRLNQAGVPAARVRSLAEFLREAQAGAHVELEIDQVDYRDGRSAQLGTGVRGLATEGGAAAPRLGADTMAILRKAGFADEEIGELVRQGAIGVGQTYGNRA